MVKRNLVVLYLLNVSYDNNVGRRIHNDVYLRLYALVEKSQLMSVTLPCYTNIGHFVFLFNNTSIKSETGNL